LRTVHYDGWLLRSTGGDSRRVNSVNCMAPGSLPLAEKVLVCEATYRRWGHGAVFRLTPLADAGLEGMLVARGYTLDKPTHVQIAETAALPVAREVEIFSVAGTEWIDAATRARGLAVQHAQIFAAQHNAIGIETAWALVRAAGEPAAVGVVAIGRGWAGLHGIYVAKEARQRGLARLVSTALIGIAHARGARRAWLQVEQSNIAALPLYASLGFRTVYDYHHRVQPV
jgi:N-acetylglutamate synthase